MYSALLTRIVHFSGSALWICTSPVWAWLAQTGQSHSRTIFHFECLHSTCEPVRTVSATLFLLLKPVDQPMLSKKLSNRIFFALVASIFLATSSLALDRSPSPEGTELYFLSPKNGDTVSGPITIVFGLKGMGVAPAGTEREHTGHHHLLINTDLPALDQPVPSDDQHKHFGKGQTETTTS